MRGYYSLLVALTIALASCEGGLPDTYKTGTVKVYALDGSLVPAPHSGIHVEYHATDSVALTVRASGEFDFLQTGEGVWWAEAIKSGYAGAARTVYCGQEGYPTIPVSLSIYEIPTHAPTMDSAVQLKGSCTLYASGKPRNGEALAFAYRDPNPDSSLLLLGPACYDVMHGLWRASRDTGDLRGKLVCAMFYNYSCDSAQETSRLLTDGPRSGFITIQ